MPLQDKPNILMIFILDSKCWNWYVKRGFVNISANWSYVHICNNLSNPCSKFSRTVRQSISICFVSSWNIWLLVMCKAEVLLQYETRTAEGVICKSLSKVLSQINSNNARAKALYLASAEDLETIFFSLISERWEKNP